MRATNTEVSLFVTADLENLAEIRRFVEQAVKTLGAGPDLIPKLCLIVDEAATNIIVHGYQGEPGQIEIGVGRRGDDLIIRLCDSAPTFDPTSVPPPDLSVPLNQRPLGGLGVHLIRQYVDKITHRARPQGGNELILTKRLR